MFDSSSWGSSSELYQNSLPFKYNGNGPENNLLPENNLNVMMNLFSFSFAIMVGFPEWAHYEWS